MGTGKDTQGPQGPHQSQQSQGSQESHGRRWQLQEAKQRFSEFVRGAETGEPQIVTRHGQDVAVAISIEEYRSLTGGRMSFHEYLISGPRIDWDEFGIDLEFGREDNNFREVDLSE